MKWITYLKRGCAVTLTVAMLAGGMNWYSLKLKAVSSSEQVELAESDGQESLKEAGESILDNLNEDRGVLDDQMTEENQSDGQSGENSMPDMQPEEGIVPDMQPGEGSMPDMQSGEGSMPDMQSGEGSMPDMQPEEGIVPDMQPGEGNASDDQRNMDSRPDVQAKEGTKTVADDQQAETDTFRTEGEISGLLESDVEDTLGLSNDELFEGYLEKLFYEDYGTAPYSIGLEDKLNQLNEEEKKLYIALKEKITQIAGGELTNTEISFSRWFTLTDQTRDLVFSRMKKLVNLLLIDCPYELYWFDKTKGYQLNCSKSLSSNDQYVGTMLSFKFIVSADYGANYEVNADAVTRANTAILNAQKIVEDYAELSDYERLAAYKNIICELTDYDYAALSGKAYGDTWQLVNVFDGDEQTKVVCEGYSKAFAYLCELSNFDKIQCYVVGGSMNGGGHMWNIVTMEDGKNYLVDVTNCDSGSIGAPDKLFLVGAKNVNGYQLTIDGYVLNYVYDTTMELYPESILNLAEKNYEPAVKVSVSIKNKTEGGYPVSYTYNGKSLADPELHHFDITAAGTDEEIIWKSQFKWYQGDQTSDQADLKNNLLEAAPANAGTYTLVAKIFAEGYDAAAETRILIHIGKADIIADYLQVKLPGNGSVYYTGSLYQAEVTGTDICSSLDTDQIHVKYRKDEETELLEEAKEIGTYHVFVTISGNGNFNNEEDLDTGKSFEIQKFVPENVKAAVSPDTSASSWVKEVMLTAPEGYLISLSLEEEFQNQIKWNKEELSEDEEYTNQTKITYYLKQQDSGAISTDPQSVYVYIDRTAPDFHDSEDGIHIEDSTDWWKELLSTITFGFYKKNNVTIQASDELSGVKEYYYYIDNPYSAGDGTKIPALTKEALDEKVREGAFKKTEDGTLAVDENSSLVIYAYAVDGAGNQSEYISSEGIITKKPAVSLAGSPEQRNYPCLFGSSGNTVMINIEEKLPDDAGMVNEYVMEVTGSNAEIVTQYAVSEDGVLSYQIQAGEAGSSAVIKVTIKTANYEALYYEVGITLSDKSFADAFLDHVNEGAGGWYHGDVAIIPPEGYQISADKKIWHSQIIITEDRKGAYYYYLKQDDTGIISEEKQITVNRDTIAPTGSITVAGSMWDRFLEKISFGMYTRTEDIVTIQAEDAASGMEGGKIEYFIADESEAYEGERGKAELEQLPKERWNILQNQARITKNRGNIVYVRLTDQAGNTAYLSTDIIIHNDVLQEPVLPDDSEESEGNPGSSSENNNSGSNGSGNSSFGISYWNGGSGTGNSTPPTNTDKAETKPEGTKDETSNQTSADSTEIENETKTQTEIKTEKDGSRTEIVRYSETDANGNIVYRTTVKTTDSTGAVMQTVEKSIFTVSRVKAVVTTVKDSRDELVKAIANVTMQGAFSATGSTMNLSGYVTDRIAKEAGTQDVQITVSVKNDKNALLYKITVNKKDLTSGNGLYVYEYDANTKKYAMVNAKKYTVSDTKSISVRVSEKSNYVLLNKAKKNQVDQQILKTIKLAKTKQTVVPGKKVKVRISEKANTKSISGITYTSSDKKIATVTKNGTVKAKSGGSVQVKAKVTLKNGKTKMLIMKVKVR